MGADFNGLDLERLAEVQMSVLMKKEEQIK